jgi:hypothetical protein
MFAFGEGSSIIIDLWFCMGFPRGMVKMTRKQNFHATSKVFVLGLKVESWGNKLR